MITMTLLFRKCLHFIIAVVHICGIYSQQTGTINEYCFTEAFQPSCNSDEVIVMKQALYGRMRTGKCIKVDFNVGCFSDELQTFDKTCSGQRTCNFPVLNGDLIASLACLREMNPYLETSYSCAKVYTPTRSKCTSPEIIQVSQAALNLASSVSMTTSCGKHDSAWILNAKPGQRLNITMTDFSWENVTEASPGDCITYGYIMEIQGSDVERICGGRRRKKHLYYSEGHEIQIVFDGYGEDQRFIVHVAAVGCPDVEKLAYSTTERQGDSVTVMCTTADLSWSLKCVGNTWLGVTGSCPPAPTTTESVAVVTASRPETRSGSKLPLVTQNHVIVFTLACVTLLACTVIIILGIYCTKRYKVKAVCDNAYKDSSLGGNSSISKATPVLYRPMYANETVRHGSIDLLTHTPILERRQTSCPNILDIPCEDSSGAPTSGPCIGGYPTVPRNDNPVLYYILENPEEEHQQPPEKIYQSLQRDNRQLLG